MSRGDRATAPARTPSSAFHPFYAWNAAATPTPSRAAYYTVQRQPRMLSAKQRAAGRDRATSAARSSSRWSIADEAPYPPSLRQLAVETLCTNRDLPLHMPLGQGAPTSRSSRARRSRASAASPARPRRAPRTPRATSRWRLISHLSLNYLSLIDSDRQRRRRRRCASCCRSTADTGDAASRKQIEGMRVDRRRAGSRGALPVPGPISLRPGPGGHRHLRRDGLRRGRACSCWARCWSGSSPSTCRSTRSPRRCCAPSSAARSCDGGPRRDCDDPSGRRRRRRPGRAPRPPAIAGRSLPEILDLLARAPDQFDFYQALRRLEAIFCDSPARPGSEPRCGRRRADAPRPGAVAGLRAGADRRLAARARRGAVRACRVQFLRPARAQRSAAAAPHRIRARSAAQRGRPDDVAASSTCSTTGC